MTYLKCPHCGYLNPLTGQYQTFCRNCNKKLENNFSDWHVVHPDKSFDDFKTIFGQTEEMGLPQKRSHRKSKFFKKEANGKTKVLWGALIGFAIMMFFITFVWNQGSKIFESFLFDKTSKILLSNPWQVITPGNNGLSFSSPINLNEFSLGLPPQVMERLEYVKSYKSDDKQPLQIMVNIEKPKPHIKSNLQGAANGAATEVMNRPDVSEFKYANNQTTISNNPAIIQTGSYVAQETYHINFKDLFIIKGRTFWQITILYKADDPSGEEVADSIIHSVSIQ